MHFMFKSEHTLYKLDIVFEKIKTNTRTRKKQTAQAIV